MTTLADIKPMDSQVLDAVCERFTFNDEDQWLYPTGATVADSLVRISVWSGMYRVERRRVPTGPWMPVVAANTAEFDAESFASWYTRWPLSV